jgi:hypothetical protein
MNLIIRTSIRHREGIIDVTRVNLTKRIMTFFFFDWRKRKLSFLEIIRRQMSRLDFACSWFSICIYVCVLHLKFTVFFFSFFIPFFYSNNLFLFNETRSKFQQGIVNVNHNVVGLPTTSGFVLTLTRFVTRTFIQTSCTLSECLIRVEHFVIFRI